MEKLRNDPDFQNDVARRELGYAAENEKTFRFTEKIIIILKIMLEKIKETRSRGLSINQEAEKNLVEWLGLKNIPKYFTDSINELVNEEQWEEINNRFFKILVLGQAE